LEGALLHCQSSNSMLSVFSLKIMLLLHRALLVALKQDTFSGAYDLLPVHEPLHALTAFLANRPFQFVLSYCLHRTAKQLSAVYLRGGMPCLTALECFSAVLFLTADQIPIKSSQFFHSFIIFTDDLFFIYLFIIYSFYSFTRLHTKYILFICLIISL
jgi:hypothetical protein